MECWGCGTRHALYAIMNFEFLQAWHYNRISFVVFAIFAYLWMKYIIKEIKNINSFNLSKQNTFLVS